MRKQDVSTLSLFLSGLSGRYSSNAEYFIGVDFKITIGNKTLAGHLKPVDEVLTLSYNGQKYSMTFDAFIKFYTSEAVKSDRAVLEYNQRTATIVIEADEKGVRSRQDDARKTDEIKTSTVLPDRDYIIKANEAPELLKAIGIMSADGRIKNNMIRKYNQIDHFIELVKPLIDADDSDTFTVLDCGCGKSYLSFVLNYYIHDVLRRKCKITGVDIMPQVIEASRETAKKLGYANMEFVCADLREYTADSPSMVISLHACDTATDMAMGLAVRSKSRSIACVPCCHHELLGQYSFPGMENITKHGIYAARFNDLFTDGLRTLKLESVGYKTSVVEYISPLDSPKNLLILAQKVADSDPKAEKEYYDLIKRLHIYPAIERECSLELK